MDQSENLEILNKQKSSPWWVLLCSYLLVLMACLHASDAPIGGGDTWVAMACGRYTIADDWATKTGDRTWQMKALDLVGIHVTQHDPFSPNSREYVPGDKVKEGWINQNWLTHVLFYKLKTTLGENSIVVYKFMQAILTGLFAYWAARKLGVHAVVAAACAAFGMLLSRSFIDLRPNISSILYAIALIWIMSCWLKGEKKKLFWIIPIMLLWSNVHGGFIYGIMIMCIMVGGYGVQMWLNRIMPGRCINVSIAQYKQLIVAALAVITMPAIFSPYGITNLTHPFLIATGADGKKWRSVSEWHPMYSPGFGNITPYLYFLGLLAIVLFVWVAFHILKPAEALEPKRNTTIDERLEKWPKIDLVAIGIMAITIFMSVQSRRFIFLGGVIVSPFLAKLVQDIVEMFKIKRALKQVTKIELSESTQHGKPWLNWVLAGCALISAIYIGNVFKTTMDKIYLNTDLTVFRRMVGIGAQPVDAMRYFSANNISGLVMNEWTNGGSIPFWQTPNKETGESPAKVFMDGRCQAAYDVSHYSFYSLARMVPPKINDKSQEKLNAYASAARIALSDPKLFFRLVEQLRMVEGESYTDKKQHDAMIKSLKAYIQIALYNPQLLNGVYEELGITAAILNLPVMVNTSKGPRKNPNSETLIKKLYASNNWAIVYRDSSARYGNPFVILLRKNAPENKKLLQTPLSQRHYPDESMLSDLMGKK